MNRYFIFLFNVSFFISHTVFSQDNFYHNVSHASIELTKDRVVYDPSYFAISYPNGDIPKGKGVCTDVVIRAYRKVGVDLQKEVHEDMKHHFFLYPKIWGLKTTDKNIDHRRVPNLIKFFDRNGTKLPITKNPSDYQPGDIISWSLGGGLTHIGMLTHRRSSDNQRYLVVHNIGSGQVLEDCLFRYKIIAHHRYQK